MVGLGLPDYADFENMNSVREVQQLTGLSDMVWKAMSEDLGFWEDGVPPDSQTMSIRDWSLIHAVTYLTSCMTVRVTPPVLGVVQGPQVVGPGGQGGAQGHIPQPDRPINVRERILLSLMWRICCRRMGADPPEDPDEVYRAETHKERLLKQVDDAIASNLAAPPWGGAVTPSPPYLFLLYPPEAC
jgi:hypothetical protein